MGTGNLWVHKTRSGRNKNEELTNKYGMNVEVCDQHQRSMLKWLDDIKRMKVFKDKDKADV